MYVDTVTIFQKPQGQWPQTTPRWPMTPLLLRSQVQLYPRNIVSKAHANTSEVCGYGNQFSKL